MASARRSITSREINRAVLARQGLIQPFDEPLPRVLERIGGIQAQYAPSMYVGLWSRMRSLRRDDLTRALEDRSVVQGTLLRGTIHLVSREDYWTFATAVRQQLRQWFVAVTKGDPSESELEAAAKQVTAALRDGPLRQSEIDALIGRRARGGINMVLDLVRVPPSGTWDRRKADLHLDAQSWIGQPDVEPGASQVQLVRRYLTGFGPATPADIANWAGLPVRTVSSALASIDHVTYRAEDGTTLVDLPELLLPDGDVSVPVRFLPTWDATLLVHARRAGILPEAYRAQVFSTKNPHSVATFLVDGAAAGTWRYQDGRIELAEFEPLPRRLRHSVDDAAEALAEFHR